MLKAFLWSYYSGFTPAIGLTAAMAAAVYYLKGNFPWVEITSYFLLVLGMYIIDRLAGNPEDANNSDLNPSAFVQMHSGKFGMILCGIGIAQALLIVKVPGLFISLTAGILVCLFYSFRIPILGLRAKEIPFFKPVYFTFACLAQWLLFARMLPTWNIETILVIYCLMIFLIVPLLLYDLKDIEGDKAAGIKTFANVTGKRPFLLLQAGLVLTALFATFYIHAPISIMLFTAQLILLTAVFYIFFRDFDLIAATFLDLFVGVPFMVGDMYLVFTNLF